ncbi:MAG: hypothetical protein LBP22_05400 [Deltaproteobacteria bacterium]|nr:hypothetical protein [Deltaproteobacteria bacterium]
MTEKISRTASENLGRPIEVSSGAAEFTFTGAFREDFTLADLGLDDLKPLKAAEEAEIEVSGISFLWVASLIFSRWLYYSLRFFRQKIF